MFRARATFKQPVLPMVYGNTVLVSTLLQNEHTAAQKNSLDRIKIQHEMSLVLTAVISRFSFCSTLHSMAKKTNHLPPFLSRGEQFPATALIWLYL